MADYRRLGHLAARQHRVFTTGQGAEHGFTSTRLTRDVDRGVLQRLATGIYAFNGATITWESRLMALVLHTGGWASHRSAARLLGLDTYARDAWLEVCVPHGRNPLVPFGTPHQSRAPHLARVEVVQGIPCAGPSRVLVDLAAVVTTRRLAHAVADLRRQDRPNATDAHLLEAYVLHRRRGRPGMPKLAAVLERQLGTEVTDSVFEHVAISTLHDAGVTGFEVHAKIYDEDDGTFIAEVDLGWWDVKVCVELDSKRFHATDGGFERDPRKRARLAAIGWLVVPVTWSMLRDDPAGVVRSIRRTIAGRRRELGLPRST